MGKAHVRGKVGASKNARKTGPQQPSRPSKKSNKAISTNSKTKNQASQRQNKPTIPFAPSDRILLVGEGDFSFALSLATKHGCWRRLVATCYDGEKELRGKYPQAEKNISLLSALSDTIPTEKKGSLKRKRGDIDDESEDFDSEHDRNQPLERALTNAEANSNTSLMFPKVLYSVDAKKLGSQGSGAKLIRNGFPPVCSHASRTPGCRVDGGPWDIICFNFPHVGGLSTDVNRQLRSNQELLLAFFKSCVPLLSIPDTTVEHGFGESATPLFDDEEDGFNSDDYRVSGGEDEKSIEPKYPPRKEPGRVIVTIFEGEPYSSWNIKGLARDAGLTLITSFKFPWSSYNGYSHSRTIGVIKGKGGQRSGWKGEERDARSFIFERRRSDSHQQRSSKTGKKRRTGGSSDDSE